MNIINRINKLVSILSGESDFKRRRLDFVVFGYTDVALTKAQWLDFINEDDYSRLENRPNHKGNRPLEPEAREVEFFPKEEVLHEEVKIH